MRVARTNNVSGDFFPSDFGELGVLAAQHALQSLVPRPAGADAENRNPYDTGDHNCPTRARHTSEIPVSRRIGQRFLSQPALLCLLAWPRDRHGKTFEDPEGYRIVLENLDW